MHTNDIIVNLPALKETEGFPRRGIELYVAGKP
jgi:hypothetical protein